jgi:hypothetical protein
MSLSDLDLVLGLLRIGDDGSQQAVEHATHVVALIEAGLHIGEVAVAALGELHGVVCATERGLDVADECVDGVELSLCTLA